MPLGAPLRILLEIALWMSLGILPHESLGPALGLMLGEPLELALRTPSRTTDRWLLKMALEIELG